MLWNKYLHNSIQKQKDENHNQDLKIKEIETGIKRDRDDIKRIEGDIKHISEGVDEIKDF